MSKAKLIEALRALAVPESEFEGLSNPQLEKLLKQKKAEQAMRDAENTAAAEEEAETDGEDAPDDPAASDDAAGTGEDDTAAEAAAETDGADDPQPDTTEPEPDPASEDDIDVDAEDPDEDSRLTKMVARSGFEVQVIDSAVVNGRRLGPGDKLKVKAEGTFHAGEKTRDHLIDYRAAARD